MRWLWLLLLASTAHADGGDFHVAGNVGKVGLYTGGVFARDRGAGFLFGGVATFVHLDDDLKWVGIQADVGLDTNGHVDTGLRWTLGPEAGYAVFGGQAGYFGERVNGDTRAGMFGGIKITVGFVALYLRGTKILSSRDDDVGIEIGVQGKYPVLRDWD